MSKTEPFPLFSSEWVLHPYWCTDGKNSPKIECCGYPTLAVTMRRFPKPLKNYWKNDFFEGFGSVTNSIHSDAIMKMGFMDSWIGLQLDGWLKRSLYERNGWYIIFLPNQTLHRGTLHRGKVFCFCWFCKLRDKNHNVRTSK